MPESKKLLAIRSLLTNYPSLNKLLDYLQELQALYPDLTSPAFKDSQQKIKLERQAEALRLPELQDLIMQISPPSSIVALPLSRSDSFTVFFVLVPEGLKFDWHSHPKMTGISKCVYGELQVAKINKNGLKIEKPGRFSYPKNEVKYSVLKTEGPSISTIDPQDFNIHRIKAVQLSAFIDILMPDYPENYCDFYLSRKEDQQVIQFKQIQESRDKLEIWQAYFEKIVKSQKTVVKNVILQMPQSE